MKEKREVRNLWYGSIVFTVLVIILTIGLRAGGYTYRPVTLRQSENFSTYTFSDNIPRNISEQSTILHVDGDQYENFQLPYSFQFTRGTKHAYSYAQVVPTSLSYVEYVFSSVSGCGFTSESATFNATNRNCTATAFYNKVVKGSTTTTSIITCTTTTSTISTSTSTSSTSSTTTIPANSVALNISNNQQDSNATVPRTGTYFYKIGSNVVISAVKCIEGTYEPGCVLGYAFSNWTGKGKGNYTGTSNISTITMLGSIKEVAEYHFVEGTTTTTTSRTTTSTTIITCTTSTSTTTITTSTSTSTSTTVGPTFYLNITTSPAGLNTTTPNSGYYAAHSNVTITAKQCVQGNCGEGWVFSNWTGFGNGGYTGTNTIGLVTMGGNIREVANYHYIQGTVTTSTSTTTTIIPCTTTTKTTTSTSVTTTIP